MKIVIEIFWNVSDIYLICNIILSFVCIPEHAGLCESHLGIKKNAAIRHISGLVGACTPTGWIFLYSFAKYLQDWIRPNTLTNIIQIIEGKNCFWVKAYLWTIVSADFSPIPTTLFLSESDLVLFSPPLAFPSVPAFSPFFARSSGLGSISCGYCSAFSFSYRRFFLSRAAYFPALIYLAQKVM